METPKFFRACIDAMINLNDPLAVLAGRYSPASTRRRRLLGSDADEVSKQFEADSGLLAIAVECGGALVDAEDHANAVLQKRLMSGGSGRFITSPGAKFAQSVLCSAEAVVAIHSDHNYF